MQGGISPGTDDAEMQPSLLLSVHQGTRTPTSLDMDSDAECKDLAKYQPANIRCPWLSLSSEAFCSGVAALFPIPLPQVPGDIVVVEGLPTAGWHQVEA